MVTAGRRASDAHLGILARSRKRRRCGKVAMHPLPLPHPPPGPLPVSACSSAKRVTGNHRHHHHQQQQHHHQAKAAVSRGWKVRSSTSATLLQRHPHSRAQQQPGSQSGAGGTSTGEQTPPPSPSSSSAAATCSTAPVDERKTEGKVIKSNMGRSDQVIIQHTQFMYSVNKTEEYCQPLNTTKKRNKRNLPLKKTSIKRNEKNHNQNAPSLERCNILKKEGEKPIISGNHCKNLKLRKVGLKSVLGLQGDQNYAGPKFSEPPSPSVLPKPPSHWVGAHAEYPDESKEIMTVHLKTLLKVNV
ncbi:proline-rich nuclear receptor coactivator 1 [Heptranchias perlo]|uniref:proline-rich nuclear receptor coactivator 1 n=1 Tax=Heptranchias perlo TaxID=212740 RepID=UPI00355A9EA3